MKRVQELDFARAAAMLAVIAIHVTSTYINCESGLTVLGMNLAFLLNQLARFAVPLFVMLSGVSLGLKGAYPGAGRFLLDRFGKIGVPYLLWTAVYLLYNCRQTLRAPTVGACLRALLFGYAASHLYFIVVILQLYVLYPLLKRRVPRAPYTSTLISFVITYTMQKILSFRQLGLDLIPGFFPSYLWILFPAWLFYFTLGLALTPPRLEKVRVAASAHAAAILPATVLIAAVYVVESRATGSLGSVKPSLTVYVPLVFLSAFSVWHTVGRFQAVQILTGFLAKHSMTVYFSHVLVLYFFRRLPWFARGMSGMLVLLLAVTVTACLASAALDEALARLRVWIRQAR